MENLDEKLELQDQARDEQGRFVKTGAEPQETEIVEPQPSFEDTLSRLLDDKLKVLFQQPQPQNPEPKSSVVRREVKQPSANDLFELQQLQLTDPVAAFKKAHEFVYGLPVDEVQKRLDMANEIARRDAVMDAGNRFLKAHPEFYDSRENGDLIFNYIDTRGWDNTKMESYEQAYKDLLTRNLLVSKEVELESVPTPTPKKAMSGIKKGSGSQPVPTKPGTLSPEERQKVSQMGDDELIARLKSQSRSQTR